MTETRPISSAQPSTDATTHASDRRPLQEDTIARFRHALTELDQRSANAESRQAANTTRRDPSISTLATDERLDRNASALAAAGRRDPNASPSADAAHRDLNTLTLANAERSDRRTSMAADDERGNLNTATRAHVERSDLNTSTAADGERRDPNAAVFAMPATIGSLHYSLPVTQVASDSAAAADNVEAARLIEQATSVLLERASRADASRFIVSLDHAIVGGASAEFVRDGAFLHVRLLARNEAAYRSMWMHRAELEERLAASTGLVTRIEILEVYGDGRSA